MLKTIINTIEKNDLLKRGDHVLVAVSGGPDSVALLRVLVILSPIYRLRLTVAHLNHGLRAGEADREEAFVRRLCETMGLACHCRRLDGEGLRMARGRSLEEVAREARYAFLKESASIFRAGKIATGHHRDDQAETFILHLIRGSGASGLKGILPFRDDGIIRPLIAVGRGEILAFLEREGLAFMEDSSNRDPLFLRNRIRKDLIPLLTEGYNPHLAEGLCQTADILRRDDEYLQGVVQEILARWGVSSAAVEILIPLDEFRRLHRAIQARIIKVLTEGTEEARTGVGYRHVEAVLRLIDESASPSGLDLPHQIRVEKRKGVLRIVRNACREGRSHGRGETVTPTVGECRVSIPGDFAMAGAKGAIRLTWAERPSLAEIRRCPQAAFMDFDKMTPPLTLRGMAPGDRMVFLGMTGEKKLKRYFIDRKIPREERGRVALLVDAKSVIWVAGERICERVKVTPETKRVLKAEMI